MNELPSVNTREASTDRPPRILVVEDEAPLGELLSYNLKAEGFEAEHIDRGDEAELCLAETPFDLVILDWMLPGVSGLEICRRMRTRDNTRDMPIIMLTARCEENERVRGLSVGRRLCGQALLHARTDVARSRLVAPRAPRARGDHTDFG